MDATNLVINIDFVNAVGVVISVCTTLILGAWYASSRLTKVETKIDGMELRMSSLEGRAGQSFSGLSPIKLLEKGEKILNESGLKKWIDENTSLFDEWSKKGPMTNPYDVQESVFKFFNQLEFPKDIEDTLKKAAFDNGVSIEVAKRVGGIYFRDICLKKLNMNVEELDKPAL